MQIKIGNLFDHLPAEGGVVIPHVVNNVGAFGAGFAAAIAAKYPTAREDYIRWFRGDNTQNDFELGRIFISTVELTGKRSVYIAHMLAQDGLPGPKNPVPLDPVALAICLKELGWWCKDFNNQESNPIKIMSPAFGCGIARGKWSKISNMIENIIGDFDVTVFFLNEAEKERITNE